MRMMVSFQLCGMLIKLYGDVDVPYLDRIEYEVRPETKWLVYYHSDEDLKRLKSVFGITGISRKFEVYFRKSDNFWDR